MKNEAPLDSLTAITARYHDVLIHHPIHHSTHPMNNALLHPLHQRMDADHSIAANHDVFLAESLGQDTKTALHTFYTDLVEQLDRIRKTNFTRDHEAYSASGFPERDALNPEGKAPLADLIGKARVLAELISPERKAPSSMAEIEKQRSDIKEMARTISALHARYKHALTPPPSARPMLESHKDLLNYSCNLVEAMHDTVAASLGENRGAEMSQTRR